MLISKVTNQMGKKQTKICNIKAGNGITMCTVKESVAVLQAHIEDIKKQEATYVPEYKMLFSSVQIQIFSKLNTK
jgi:hypothetical protein